MVAAPSLRDHSRSLHPSASNRVSLMRSLLMRGRRRSAARRRARAVLPLPGGPETIRTKGSGIRGALPGARPLLLDHVQKGLQLGAEGGVGYLYLEHTILACKPA